MKENKDTRKIKKLKNTQQHLPNENQAINLQNKTIKP